MTGGRIGNTKPVGGTLARLLGLVCAALLLAWAPPAYAKRVALIIANSTYYVGTSLRNPVEDAKVIEAAAQKAGFEVTVAQNLDRSAFSDVLYKFQAAAQNAEVAMIYYAGHGIETPDGKFVIPIDAELPDAFYVPDRAINVNRMLVALSSARNGLLVLDACRADPFTGAWNSSTRALQVGFKNDFNTGRNMMVLLSAGPNQVAQDGARGQGSPFANSFAKWLDEPGQTLTQLQPKVAKEVADLTRGLQTPVGTSSLTDDIVLVPLAKPNLSESDAWLAADAAKTIEGYQSFIDSFPNSSFVDTAAGRISRLGGTPKYPSPEKTGLTIAEAPIKPQPDAPAPKPREPLIVFNPPPQQTSPVQANSGPATSRPASAPSSPPAGNNVVVAPPATNTTPVSTQPPPAQQNPQIATRPQTSGPVLVPSPTVAREETSAVKPVTVPPSTAPASPALTPPAPSPGPATGRPASNVSGSAGGEASALNRSGIEGFATATDRQALPAIPAPPKFTDAGYPTCKDNFKTAGGAMAQINAIDACTSTLNTYYQNSLLAYNQQMIDYQKSLDRLYVQDVAPKTTIYSVQSQQDFYQRILAEIAKANPDGPYFVDYNGVKTRLDADKAYLAEQRPIYVQRLSQGL